jgi:RimJ/RimL family protein N-acetyltransferase
MENVKQVTILAKEARRFFKTNSQLGRSLSEMYCDVWREPPWNEDFWVPSEVKKELVEQNSRDSAVGCYAFCENRTIGFTLGYQIQKEEMREISSGMMFDYLFLNGDIIFYIDELAVENRFRNNGIANSLCQELIECAIDFGAQTFILRTDVRALPARRVYQKNGFWDTEIKDGKHETRTYLIKR